MVTQCFLVKTVGSHLDLTTFRFYVFAYLAQCIRCERNTVDCNLISNPWLKLGFDFVIYNTYWVEIWIQYVGFFRVLQNIFPLSMSILFGRPSFWLMYFKKRPELTASMTCFSWCTSKKISRCIKKNRSLPKNSSLLGMPPSSYAEEGGTPTPYMGAHCRHMAKTISHLATTDSLISQKSEVTKNEWCAPHCIYDYCPGRLMSVSLLDTP